MIEFLDDELTKRASAMLASMALLMDGNTGAGGGGTPGTNPPESSSPKMGDSLYIRYFDLLQLVAPFELRKLRVILLRGEEELRSARLGATVVRRHESRDDRAKRFIKMYVGWTPVEVAFAEECSEAFVRKIRGEQGCEQTDGTPIV